MLEVVRGLHSFVRIKKSHSEANQTRDFGVYLIHSNAWKSLSLSPYTEVKKKICQSGYTSVHFVLTFLSDWGISILLIHEPACLTQSNVAQLIS